MNRFVLLLLGTFFCMLLLACRDDSTTAKNSPYGTASEGTIHISVDESFKPVIEEQIKVYESTYPNAHIIAAYKPEVECFKDLQSDSTRMIIVARDLKRAEHVYYYNKLKFYPNVGNIAYDAIAVIVNKNSNDTAFTLQRLKNILSGKENTIAVMDGHNATSTVRHLQDSIMKGTKFGENVVAAGNSQQVVSTVSAREDAIGFVGLSWVGDLYDVQQQAGLKNVKIASVQCTICKDGEYAKPSQATITYLQYPLARPLYYVVKENVSGLGAGFANFMSVERGQLIFRRAFLAPAKINFNKRTSNIKNDD